MKKLNGAIEFILGTMDAVLIMYLLWLQLAYLSAGDTMMFLLATIACGVWSLSSTWMRQAIKEGKSHE